VEIGRDGGNASSNKSLCDERFEVFTVVKIQVEVFWVVMPRSVAVGYQHFGGPCCISLSGEDLIKVFLSFLSAVVISQVEGVNFLVIYQLPLFLFGSYS
jgi:hypothetical protein